MFRPEHERELIALLNDPLTGQMVIAERAYALGREAAALDALDANGAAPSAAQDQPVEDEGGAEGLPAQPAQLSSQPLVQASSGEPPAEESSQPEAATEEPATEEAAAEAAAEPQPEAKPEAQPEAA